MYYTMEYDDNADVNAQHYCPLCGADKVCANSQHNDDSTLTPTEVLNRLGEIFDDDPVLVEVLLARLKHPEMSLRQLATKIKRCRITVQSKVKKIEKDIPSLSKFITWFDTNRVQAQQKRRKLEKICLN